MSSDCWMVVWLIAAPMKPDIRTAMTHGDARQILSSYGSMLAAVWAIPVHLGWHLVAH
jgi:hypothetical protein